MKDSPARREDFLELSNIKKLLVKFCSHRSLKNVFAAERAILIWDDVKSYVKNVEMGKIAKVKTKSFHTVAEATKDKLLIIKFQFFSSVAKVLEPFFSKVSVR